MGAGLEDLINVLGLYWASTHGEQCQRDPRRHILASFMIQKAIQEKKQIGYKEVCVCNFANRIVGKWNVLPDSCMICTTLNDSKTKIKLQLELETQCNVMFDS